MRDAYGIDGHKLDLHIDRVYEWKFRGDTTPIYVEVSPTAACNHACTFCALDYANHTKDKISKQKLLEIGEQMTNIGVRGVMFGGEGEPTLHPDLADIIGVYHGLELDCGLTTNGTGLDGHFATEGGEFLKWVKVSVNGGDALTYANIHNTTHSQWDSVWDGIRDFRKGCLNHQPVIGVQCVAVEENYRSLPQLVIKAGEEGVDYVVIKPFSPNEYSPNSKNTKAPDPDSLAIMLHQCRYFETKKTKLITRDSAIHSALNGPTYEKCLSVPFFWFYINSKAEVVACPNHMKDPRFILGNLNTKTLQDIWYSHSELKREELKGVMRKFDVRQCRKACRMDRVNEWLWHISQDNEHKSFI